jgi:hypothetical protein
VPVDQIHRSNPLFTLTGQHINILKIGNHLAARPVHHICHGHCVGLSQHAQAWTNHRLVKFFKAREVLHSRRILHVSLQIGMK